MTGDQLYGTREELWNLLLNILVVQNSHVASQSFLSGGKTDQCDTLYKNQIASYLTQLQHIQPTTATA